MTLADRALSIAFSEARKQTPATLIYNNEKVTGVIGFLSSEAREMEDAGFQKQYNDVTVVVKSEDVSSWVVKRDMVIDVLGNNVSGSMVVRDPIRYLGNEGFLTWLVLDVVY